MEAGIAAEPLQRDRLLAVLAADAVGYSRLMTLDDRATLAALDACREVFIAEVANHSGRVVDMAGDSVLAVFENATAAVMAALVIQRRLADVSAPDVLEDRRMRFRIGVHLGDVIEKADGTVYGDGVNIAARLQAIAQPGGTVISEAVRGAVKAKVLIEFISLGERAIKNYAEPIRVYEAHESSRRLREATGVDVARPVEGFNGRPAIAVLPFVNMSGTAEQDYFADGLSEDIITRLAAWRWLPIISRNSTFAYKGASVNAKELGGALGASYILEGSVRRAADRIRVTGQLIDAVTGHHLWADRYDRVLEDLFAVQDELTDGIVSALETAVGRAESERVRVKASGSLDAWESFQQGMWHLQHLTQEHMAPSLPLFLRALELDPGMAAAHSAIAWLRIVEARFLWTKKPAEAVLEALVHAQAAVIADPMDSTSYSLLGCALSFTGAHDEALVACQKSVELNPSNASAYGFLANTHLFRGEPELTIRAVETAIRLSPNDVWLQVYLGILGAGHYLARNYQRAVDVAKLGVQRAPGYPTGWRILADAQGRLGLKEASAALAKLSELTPDFASEDAARATLNVSRRVSLSALP